MLSRNRNKFSYYKSLKVVAILSVVISLLALFSIIIFVFANGTAYVTLNFLFGPYSENNPTIYPAIIGTLELILISLIIATPVGIFTAIFLVEYMNSESKLIRIIKITIETLAGIPSIVYGLFGYLIFVVNFGWGYSLFGGGITLSIMILPVIVRSTEESLMSVPNELREGSYALGTSKVKTIFKVVLPCASSGIVTSLILAVGRVLSESAVLILTIGMVVNKVPENIMSAGTSLALDIYYFGSYGHPNESAATAVVLLFLILFINLIAYFVGNLLKKGKNFNGN